MKLRKYTKYFAELTHYTSSEGAKGIVKNGLQNGRRGFVSFFPVEDDVIRDEERWNMSDMIDKMSKRQKRIDNQTERNKKIWSSFFNEKGELREDLTEEEKKLWEKLKRNGGHDVRTHKYGTWSDGGYQAEYMYLHGNTSRGLFVRKNPDWGNGEEIAPGIFKRDEYSEALTFPDAYKQISSIGGVGRGGNKAPVYRAIISTKDKNLDSTKMDTGYAYSEVKADAKDLDQATRKMEIPRGMYNSTKKIKRVYIDDYDDLKDFYNIDDKATEEAVIDIKKKREFLSRGHGKKTRGPVEYKVVDISRSVPLTQIKKDIVIDNTPNDSDGYELRRKKIKEFKLKKAEEEAKELLAKKEAEEKARIEAEKAKKLLEETLARQEEKANILRKKKARGILLKKIGKGTAITAGLGGLTYGGLKLYKHFKDKDE